jgi:protein involved in polysaccharide export with SLBB domain
MRVADVIAAAGGPLSIATADDATPVPVGDLASAVVVREGAPLPISIAVALRGNPAHNVHAYPGDYLYVPMADERSVRIMGQVRSPVVFAPPEGLRLTEALARAGGIDAGGDKSDVRVVRGPLERPVAFSADIGAIIDGEGSDVEVAPGDLVFVTDDPLEDVGEVLSVIAPLASLAATVAFTALLLEL